MANKKAVLYNVYNQLISKVFFLFNKTIKFGTKYAVF